MADIAGKLYRELQTDQRRAGRAQRRAERLSKYKGLGAAIRERTAELKWYLDGDPEAGTAIHAGEHPGTAALAVVGSTLAQFDMPSGYDIQYKGMSRTSGRGQHAMDEGTITVGVIAPARSGIKAYFDIPLSVKKSRIIDPSVLMHQGIPRILAQSTFDDIFGQKEFHTPPADRPTMFSPPPSREEAQEIRERPWTTMRRKTVFDVMPKRSHIQAALRGYTTEEDVRHAQYTKPPTRLPGKATYKIRIRYTMPKFELGLSDNATAEEAHRLLQNNPPNGKVYEMGGLKMKRDEFAVKDVGGGKVEIEEHTEMFYDNKDEYGRRLLPEEVKREVLVPAIEQAGMHNYIIDSFRKVAAEDWDHRAYVTPTNRIASSYLQEAEREQMLVPKMQVTLSQDVEAKERGGEYYILPEGERMTLLRSLDGTDEGRFEVEDSDGCKWIVPGCCFKPPTKKGFLHQADVDVDAGVKDWIAPALLAGGVMAAEPAYAGDNPGQQPAKSEQTYQYGNQPDPKDNTNVYQYGNQPHPGQNAHPFEYGGALDPVQESRLKSLQAEIATLTAKYGKESKAADTDRRYFDHGKKFWLETYGAEGSSQAANAGIAELKNMLFKKFGNPADPRIKALVDGGRLAQLESEAAPLLKQQQESAGKKGSLGVAPKRPFDRKRGFFFNEPPPPPPTPTPTPSGGGGLPKSYKGYIIKNYYVDSWSEVERDDLMEMVSGGLPDGGVVDGRVIWTENPPKDVLDVVNDLLENVYDFGADETDDVTAVETVDPGTKPSEGLSESDNPRKSQGTTTSGLVDNT